MQLKNDSDKINKSIEVALQNLSALIDVNTVVGNPIKTENNDYIVPISKVTIGAIVGGGEYGKIGIFHKGDELPYSAGNGAIISMKPCGFLVKDSNGYKVLSIADNPYEKLIEKATDFMSELKKWEYYA